MKFGDKVETKPVVTGPVPAEHAIAAGIIQFKDWMKQNRKPMPREIPEDAIEAARWWMKIQRPADDYADAPRQVNVVGGGTRWEQPYVLRLLHNFRAFCQLPSDQRSTVLAAEEDGVYWNGDKIKDKHGKPLEFIRIHEQTEKMREMGTRQYVLETLPKLRATIEKMTK